MNYLLAIKRAEDKCRSLAYTEFMTLLGNFVRTSGQGQEKRVEERKQVMRKRFMKT